MKRRLLALLLTLAILLSMTAGAFAENAEPVIVLQEASAQEETVQEEPVQEEYPAQEEEPEPEQESIYPIYSACGEEAVWVLTEDGDLTISGRGEMDDYSGEDSQPWAVYSLEIRSVTVERKITSIGDAAFLGEYENLKTVHLPDTLERIGDHAFEGCLKLERINGPIWALIALDTNAYEPAEGDVTREALIRCILDAQLEDGGWAFSGESADSDMTGMALTALAPYYVPETKAENSAKLELTEAQIEINEAIERGVECLSNLQFANGAFGTFGGSDEIVETSESTAQAVVALTALNIDTDTDECFVKNGNSALDALLSYGLAGGGFKHLMDGERGGMATEQGYYALTAYVRYLMGLNRLYDMRDAFDPEAELIQPLDLYIRIAK